MPGARILERQLRRGSAQLGLVVVYHRTGPRRGDDAHEIDPATSVSDLRRNLELLRAHYRVVGADEIVEAVSSRRPGQRFPVAITFDDDVACHLDHAAPVLRSLGLPATFFLTGASLEGPNPHWWEDLQRAVDGGRLHLTSLPELDAQLSRRALDRVPGALHQAMWAVASLPSEERDSVAARLRPLAGEGGDRGLRVADVRELRRAGLTIGFHTLRHYELTTLDSAGLEQAMREGRQRLSEAADTALTSIGYPHGSCNARVAEAARAAGFLFGFTTTPRPVRHNENPLQIGRVVPTRRSPASFAMQVVHALRRAHRNLPPR